MKQTLLVTLLLTFAFIQQSVAQEKTITGKVTSTETGEELPGVSIRIKGSTNGATTDLYGRYTIRVSEGNILVFSYLGYQDKEITVGKQTVIDVALSEEIGLEELVIVSGKTRKTRDRAKRDRARKGKKTKTERNVSQNLSGKVAGVQTEQNKVVPPPPPVYIKDKESEKKPKKDKSNPDPWENGNTESYDRIYDNPFLKTTQNPLSTFSIDVDNASYANVRRFLNNGEKPPKDAVRIEELVNYFDYDYPQPTGEDPFSINTEISQAPWNAEHKLLHIGLQGKSIPTENLPASNLVFLIDVSGSMGSENKLPLLKKAFQILVKQLRPQDKVAIVVYAGAAGLVLPSTSGSNKAKIIQALENLQAGGSTAGGAGIKLAYKIALENLNPEGNNRVIIATDGDFNVGASSDADMVRLIEEKRKSNIFLTCLGFGMGNYKDSKMEKLADKGNGNYAYIDNIQEANKVFVKEFGGTLFTIAKDVKLQLEFNPTKVQAYRLIGYENRVLANEDFNDDTKDAGELGAGHTVTALYEIIPVGVKSKFVKKSDKLKYQNLTVNPQPSTSKELLTVKFRYKTPKGNTSKLIEQVVLDKSVNLSESSNDFRFSAAVAGFGMLLRDSKYKGSATYSNILQLAQNAKGTDLEGYRAEFLNLLRLVNNNSKITKK